jgi:hypothetical protein
MVEGPSGTQARIQMAKTLEGKILEKRIHAAYHEAGHCVVGKIVCPRSSMAASIDDIGNGSFNIYHAEKATRDVKLKVAVAGFLSEAKGIAGIPLSRDRVQTRTMATQINRLLREGHPAFQVDVFLTNGGNEPAGTNQVDFAFLLSDVASPIRNFKAFLGADSWVNEIQDAIETCASYLQYGQVWNAVELIKDRLLQHGHYSIGS